MDLMLPWQNGYGTDYGVSHRTLHKIFEMLELRKSKYQKTSPSERRNRTNSQPAVNALGVLDATIATNSSGNENENGIASTDDSSDHDIGNSIESNIPVNSASAVSDDEEWGVAGFIDNSYSYSVEVSMMEIYNEQVRDLLVSATTAGPDSNLDIKQSADGGVNVPGLKLVPVKSVDDVMAVFAKGSGNRATSSTSMNEHSSRSHLILMVTVTTVTGDGQPMRGKLHLVDLAGTNYLSLIYLFYPNEYLNI